MLFSKSPVNIRLSAANQKSTVSELSAVRSKLRWVLWPEISGVSLSLIEYNLIEPLDIRRVTFRWDEIFSFTIGIRLN